MCKRESLADFSSNKLESLACLTIFSMSKEEQTRDWDFYVSLTKMREDPFSPPPEEPKRSLQTADTNIQHPPKYSYILNLRVMGLGINIG